MKEGVIVNSIEQTLQQLERYQKNGRLWHKMLIFLLLCSVAFSFLMPSLIAVSGSAAIICLMLSRWERKRAEELLAKSQTMEGLCSVFSQVDYLGREVWKQDELAQWEMLPIRLKGNNLLCQHGFTGTSGKRTVVGAEVTFHYETPLHKGNYLFLNGTMLRSDAGVQGQNWLLLRNGLLDTASENELYLSAGYKQESFGDLDLDEGFTLFCKPGSEKPGAEQLERIAGMIRNTNHLGAFRVDENTSALFLAGKFYTSVLPAGSITREMLTASLLQERDDCLELLGIDSALSEGVS